MKSRRRPWGVHPNQRRRHSDFAPPSVHPIQIREDFSRAFFPSYPFICDSKFPALSLRCFLGAAPPRRRLHNPARTPAAGA